MIPELKYVTEIDEWLDAKPYVGFDPSLNHPSYQARLKSCDTTKHPVCG